MATHLEVHRVNFNMEDMLDWKAYGDTLREEMRFRALEAVPNEVFSDGMETEFEIDGQHVIVKFLMPQAG